MNQKQLLFDGSNLKSINPWDLDSTQGWTILGGNQEPQQLDILAQRVPWLYRAIKDRSNNVSSMPWCIEMGEDEVSTSATWSESKPRELEFISSPRKLFSQIEQSMVMAGKAYLALEVNKGGYIQSIKYLNPATIAEVYNKNRDTTNWHGQEYKPGDLMGYTRTINGQTFDCSRSDKPAVPGMVQIVAVYDPDYTVEIGPGKASDALAALTAAGVLYSYDTFVQKYFANGAIKASILTVEGATQSETTRLENWWSDVVTGIPNAWRSIVIALRGGQTPGKIAPVVIGEGMEGLKDNDLSTLRRQDISTALGIPESRLWSAAANMATRKEDEAAYFRGTIMPECDLIQEALNEQIFNAIHHLDGYRIEFQPETLDVFQEDESQRAGSLGQLITSGVPLLMAMDILGYDLTDEQRAELEALAAPEPDPEPVITPITETPIPVPAPEPMAEVEEPEAPIEDVPTIDQIASIRAMLKNWQKKALHAHKLTGFSDVGWETDLLPQAQVNGIHASLIACETPEQIKGVFGAVDIGKPALAEIAMDDDGDLIAQLKRAIDVMERMPA